MDIPPDKQNTDSVFPNTAYHIDCYQRDYKWISVPVTSRFPCYYPNTFATNVIEGRANVVDYQQRLTTLTLINLHHPDEFEQDEQGYQQELRFDLSKPVWN